MNKFELLFIIIIILCIVGFSKKKIIEGNTTSNTVISNMGDANELINDLDDKIKKAEEKLNELEYQKIIVKKNNKYPQSNGHKYNWYKNKTKQHIDIIKKSSEELQDSGKMGAVAPPCMTE